MTDKITNLLLQAQYQKGFAEGMITAIAKLQEPEEEKGEDKHGNTEL